jgi:hypothetical protein
MSVKGRFTYELLFEAGAPPAETSAFCSLIAPVSHSNAEPVHPSPIINF